MSTSRINIIVGSDSDKKYFDKEIERWCEENQDVAVLVHIASADNSPELVEELCTKFFGPKVGLNGYHKRNIVVETGPSRKPTIDETVDCYARKLMAKKSGQAMISGAGMSNMLTGAVKRHATVKDLVIGVPFLDTELMGISAFLATDEKPPRNPVLSMPVNGIYTALNIGLKFEDYRWGDRKVKITDYVGASDIAAAFEKIGLPCYVQEHHRMEPDDVVITPFRPGDTRSGTRHLLNIDEIIAEGNGVQIGVKIARGDNPPNFDGYLEIVNHDYDSTGFVSAGSAGYANAAIIAAQITRKTNPLKAVALEKAKKTVDQLKEITFQYPTE
ncbi:MAG: hypothetical protein ABII01_05005 [Candidatus Woesearchaeota archaeon]